MIHCWYADVGVYDCVTLRCYLTLHTCCCYLHLRWVILPDCCSGAGDDGKFLPYDGFLHCCYRSDSPFTLIFTYYALRYVAFGGR